MDVFDERLTDPEPKAVLEVVALAVAAVNTRSRMRTLEPSQAALKRLASRLRDEPEGVEAEATAMPEQWPTRAGQVVVAWWTAAFVRRHVRVTGRRLDAEQISLLSRAMLNSRPPVWHVFPERVYRRRVGKVNDLVAACGCGAFGSERALGWAGPCCGPCLDYAEEHGAAPRSRPALLPTPQRCLAVAASAGGRWVAGATANRVYVWDLDAGTDPPWEFPAAQSSELPPRVALSRDSSFLAVVGAVSHGLRVSDLTGEVAKHTRIIPDAAAVAFRPSGRELAYTSTGRLMLAGVNDLHSPGEAVRSVTDSGPVVFSPDGERVAVRSVLQIHVHTLDAPGQVVTVHLPDSRMSGGTLRPPHMNTTAHAAFSPDGGQIAVAAGEAVAVHFAATGDRRFWDGTHPATITGLAYDPGGKWLYAGRDDGTVLAYRTDLFDADKTVTLRWSLGPVTGLAVSGDGESLFTAGNEGVKVWPVRRLLDGL